MNKKLAHSPLTAKANPLLYTNQLINFARAARARKDWEAAKRSAQEVLSQRPGHKEALVIAATAADALQEYRDAGELWQLLGAIEPDNPRWRKQAIVAFRKSGHPEMSLILVADAAKRDDGDWAKQALGRQVGLVVAKAIKLMHQGDPLEAATVLTSSDELKGHPRYSIVGNRLLPILKRFLRSAQSERDRERQALLTGLLLKLDNRCPMALVAKARLEGSAGKFREAALLWQALVEIEPSSVEHWKSLSNCLKRMGRSAESQEARQRALDLEQSPTYSS